MFDAGCCESRVGSDKAMFLRLGMTILRRAFGQDWKPIKVRVKATHLA
jgi:hypothetical protein